MRFATVTIKDIAKALNLSTSTVSRALRGRYEISENTRKLVLDYAEKINYQPNPIAQSLKERKSRSIGVVVSEIANYYFSQVINGIESIAYKRGYHIIISQSHESFEREKLNIQHLVSRSVDGLLISLSSETKEISYLKDLREKGLPLVFFDRIPESIETHKVVANNLHGAFQATEHLITEGFINIAHITNSPHLSITKERLQGYKQALEKNGKVYNEDLIRYCNHSGMIESEVEEAIKQLFANKRKPDAIFTSSDRITTGCLTALKKMHVNVSDIGFAGFTNSNLTDLFAPALTAVRQPAFEIGQTAIELLIEMIESKKPVTSFQTKMLDTSLVIRQSSLKNKTT